MKKIALFSIAMVMGTLLYAQDFKNIYAKGGVGISNLTQLKYYDTPGLAFDKNKMKPTFIIGGGIEFVRNYKNKKSPGSFSNEILFSYSGYSTSILGNEVAESYGQLLVPIIYNSNHIEKLGISVGLQPSLILFNSVKSTITTKERWLKFNPADVAAIVGVEFRGMDKIVPGIRFTYGFTPTMEDQIRRYSAMVYVNYNFMKLKSAVY